MVVDRGQRDVLVGAAVAGDVVRVEQLVVVAARLRQRLPAIRVGVRRQRRAGLLVERHGEECRVIDEGVAGDDHRCGGISASGCVQIEAGCRAFDET